MKPKVYTPIIIAAAALAGIVGYSQFSNQSETQQTQQTQQSPIEKQNNMNNTASKPQQRREMTPSVIAKAKNVPESLNNPQGNFILVAVVEGVDANRKLNQSLQIVGAQRQRLALLSRQFDQTPATSVQQRELIAGQINETRKTLDVNLRFMATNYAYTLNNSYILVPHQAALIAVTEEDGRAKAEPAFDFKTSESYEEFQKSRDTYLRLKLEQAKEAQEEKAVLVKEGKAIPESDPTAENPTKLPLTPEMEQKREELQALFNYDPEKNYQVNFEKTALYARKAR